jgi:hypothetical protein
MLKRETLLLMMIAIALGGSVLIFESQQQRKASVANGSDVSQSSLDSASDSSEISEGGAAKQAGAGELIFSFGEADVEGITLQRPDGTLVFSKAAEGTWQMTKPQAAPAESGAIAFLLTQLTNPATRTLNVEASTLKDFGLAQPDTTITLLAKGQSYELAVGITDFSGDKLYVRATETQSATSDAAASDSTDAAADAVKVYVVSGGLENAINRPTTGWLATAAETTKPKAAETDAETAVAETAADAAEAVPAPAAVDSTAVDSTAVESANPAPTPAGDAAPATSDR